MGWAALAEALWGSGGRAVRGRGAAAPGDGGFNPLSPTITPTDPAAAAGKTPSVAHQPPVRNH